MDISELIQHLKQDAEKINQDKIEELDFDRLEENLNSASEILKKLGEKEKTSDRILEDYKSEIKRLALSLSRLKGENANLELMEKYLREENLSYEELSLLRKQLKSEFDKSFSTTPIARAFYPFSENKSAKDKITEFKV